MKSPLFKLEEGIPKLKGATCKYCGFKWFPAVFYGCERCGAYGKDLAPTAFEGVGRVLSQADVKEGEGRFNLALIELDAGPVLGGIVDAAAVLSIGEKVEAYDLKIDAETVIRFRK